MEVRCVLSVRSLTLTPSPPLVSRPARLLRQPAQPAGTEPEVDRVPRPPHHAHLRGRDLPRGAVPQPHPRGGGPEPRRAERHLQDRLRYAATPPCCLGARPASARHGSGGGFRLGGVTLYCQASLIACISALDILL